MYARIENIHKRILSRSDRAGIGNIHSAAVMLFLRVGMSVKHKLSLTAAPLMLEQGKAVLNIHGVSVQTHDIPAAAGKEQLIGIIAIAVVIAPYGVGHESGKPPDYVLNVAYAVTEKKQTLCLTVHIKNITQPVGGAVRIGNYKKTQSKHSLTFCIYIL